jgi:hypothetical protein
VSCSTGDFLLQTGSQTRAKKMRIAGEEVESGGCKINFSEQRRADPAAYLNTIARTKARRAASEKSKADRRPKPNRTEENRQQIYGTRTGIDDLHQKSARGKKKSGTGSAWKKKTGAGNSHRATVTTK